MWGNFMSAISNTAAKVTLGRAADRRISSTVSKVRIRVTKTMKTTAKPNKNWRPM